MLQAFSRPRCPLLHTSRRRSRGARNDLSRFPSRSDGLCLGHVHRDEARDAPQRRHPHAVDGPRHRRRHGTAPLRGRRRGVLLREEPAAQHWVLAPLQDVQDVPGRLGDGRAGAHVHEQQRRVLLRVRQGRGFQPDGRDHPLEDAVLHRLGTVWKSTSVSGALLGDDAAILARSSGEEPASPRHRAGAASMAWRTTR